MSYLSVSVTLDTKDVLLWELFAPYFYRCKYVFTQNDDLLVELWT